MRPEESGLQGSDRGCGVSIAVQRQDLLRDEILNERQGLAGSCMVAVQHFLPAEGTEKGLTGTDDVVVDILGQLFLSTLGRN